MPFTPPVRRFLSSRDPAQLLHAIVDTREVVTGRVDVSPPTERLQLSVVALKEGASVPPHIHQPREKSSSQLPFLTQESWIVLRGGINVRLYDENGNFIAVEKLAAGQLLVSFHGGHAFDQAELNTVIIECKNGPYEGRDYSLIEDLPT